MHVTLDSEAKKTTTADKVSMQVELSEGGVVVPVRFPKGISEDELLTIQPTLALIVTLLRGGVETVWLEVAAGSEVDPVVARDVVAGQFKHFCDESELVATQERGNRHIAIRMHKK